MKSMSAKGARSRRLSDGRAGSSASSSRATPPRIDSGTVRLERSLEERSKYPDREGDSHNYRIN